MAFVLKKSFHLFVAFICLSAYGTLQAYDGVGFASVKEYSELPADLRSEHGGDFSRLDLVKADFRGRDLHGANFSGANLRGANFEESNLENANFEGAILYGVSFRRAKLSGANFSGSQTLLSFASFRLADLQGANFSEARIYPRVDMSRSNLSSVNFKGAQLADPRLEDDPLISFITASEHAADLSRSNLEKAQFQGAYLGYVDFTEARVNGTSFKDASLSNASLPGVEGKGTNFIGAELYDANFYEAKLPDSKWSSRRQVRDAVSLSVDDTAVFMDELATQKKQTPRRPDRREERPSR